MSSLLLQRAQNGFAELPVDQKYKDQALEFLEAWLDKEEFNPYKDQLTQLLKDGHWDYLLDCFYQVIPFGTGGRRGEVGI